MWDESRQMDETHDVFILASARCKIDIICKMARRDKSASDRIRKAAAELGKLCASLAPSPSSPQYGGSLDHGPNKGLPRLAYESPAGLRGSEPILPVHVIR